MSVYNWSGWFHTIATNVFMFDVYMTLSYLCCLSDALTHCVVNRNGDLFTLSLLSFNSMTEPCVLAIFWENNVLPVCV